MRVASIETTLELWASSLREVKGRIRSLFTQDRVGLLFAITHTLFKLGLLIHLARISTNADQALDVFYVSARNGNKITDLERMRELRAALLDKLEQDPAESVPA